MEETKFKDLETVKNVYGMVYHIPTKGKLNHNIVDAICYQLITGDRSERPFKLTQEQNKQVAEKMIEKAYEYRNTHSMNRTILTAAIKQLLH